MLNIAGENFKDKKELRDFIHQLLQQTPINKILTDKDERVIEHLLTHHPEYKQKTLSGIRYLCIGTHKESGGRAYCVVTNDGKRDTFSIKKCVNAWEQHTQKQKKENNQKKENTRYELSRQKPKQETTQPQQKTTQQHQTLRENILAFLKDTPKQRKDIIHHIYGQNPKPWQIKHTGRTLSNLIKKGDLHRIKTGVYALGNGIPIPKKKTPEQLRTGIKNALKTGEKSRADIMQAVYGDNVPATHTQHVQNMLKSLCDTKQIVKIRHGVYAPLNDTAENNTDIHQRIARIAAQLANCQNELKNIQELIQTETEKQNEQ